MRYLVWVLALGMVLVMRSAVAWAGDQPQWGQRWSRNMVSEETGLPDWFDPVNGTNVRWSAALGTQSYATPIVAGGKVLIGTNNEQPRDPQQTGDRGVLMCFDEMNGTLAWQLLCLKLTNSIYWDWPRDGWCSPATVESNRVYVVSNRGELLKLDLSDSRGTAPARSRTETAAVWRCDLIAQCGVRQHDSAHASPLLHGQFLYVNTSNGVDDSHREIHAPAAPSLVVVDKESGRLVAQDDEHIGPKIFHCTWSSPSLGEVHGRSLVFFGGGDGVVYAFEALRNAPSAGTVAKLKKVWWFDCDPDGPKTDIHAYLLNRQKSPSNIYSMPVFYKDRVYVTVGGDMWWGKREAWLKCIDATQTGDITGRGERWSYPLQRHSISTPAIAGGLVFVADVGRFLHCVDAETGQAYWRHDLGGEVWASPLVADGKVFIGTRKGEVWVFTASREKKLLSTVKLDSPVTGTVTAANGTLYVATMTRLYAIGNRTKR